MRGFTRTAGTHGVNVGALKRSPNWRRWESKRHEQRVRRIPDSERWKYRHLSKPKAPIVLAPIAPTLAVRETPTPAEASAHRPMGDCADRQLSARPLPLLPQADRLRREVDRACQRQRPGSFSFRLRACVANAAGSRRPSGNGVRPERTQMKLITNWGVRSRRLDQLLERNCPHCDAPFGRLVRHDAQGRDAGLAELCELLRALRAVCIWIYTFPAFLRWAAHSFGENWARILADRRCLRRHCRGTGCQVAWANTDDERGVRPGSDFAA